MTLGDLIRHIGLEFGLDQTVAGDEYLLMTDWANAAVLDFLTELGGEYSTTTLNLVAGTADYTLSSSLLQVRGVKYNAINGTQVELEQRSLQDILDMREFSSVANDSPRYYAHEDDQFWVYPTPSANDTISIYGIPKPTVMSSAANDPGTTTYGGIPTEYQDALLAYMRWRASQYDERRTPHTPNDYRTFYDQEKIRVRKKMRRRGGRQMAPASVGYPGHGSFPRSNDRYPER